MKAPFSRVHAVLLSLGLMAVAGAAVPAARRSAIFEDLPLIGSLGGTSFARTCPAGSVLAGIRFRSGLLLDGIGIRCRAIQADGTLGSAYNSGTMAGGNGGTAGSATCLGTAVIASQRGASQGGVGVGTLHFFCHQWFPASRSWGGSSVMTLSIRTAAVLPSLVTSTCAGGTAPARGIYGRHGSIVDAVALRCLAP